MAGDERSERGGAADAATSSSDALLIVGEADEITWANDAAHSLLGVADLVDTDLNRLLELRAGQGLANLRGRTPQRALGTLAGRDDERVPAEIGLAPLQDKAGLWVVTILPLPRSQLSVRELLRRANEDRLTTLVNRSYFIESVEATFRDPATVDFPYALAMLDQITEADASCAGFFTALLSESQGALDPMAPDHREAAGSTEGGDEMFAPASPTDGAAEDLNPAEMARQLANLSPKAAKAVAAAAKASTEAERDAALAAVEAEDGSVNRGLLLKFLGSVDS